MDSDPQSRLDSWKEIAAYLKKSVRTVQRWERTDGLPVHRLGQDRGLVFAYKSELDSWWADRTRTADAATAASIPENTTASVAPPRARLWPAIAAVALLSCAIAGLLWKLQPTAARVYRPIPITTEHGSENSPTFSPDGNRIAYVWTPKTGAPRLCIKGIGANSAVQVKLGDGPVAVPSWSPDGRWIACLQHGDDPQLPIDLLLVPPAGGTPTRLTRLSQTGPLGWSSDSQWIIAADGPPLNPWIAAISATTGVRHPLTKPADFGFSGAALSPDSQHLVYAPFHPGESIIYDLPLGPGLVPTGEPQVLRRGAGYAGITFEPSGEGLIFAAGLGDEEIGLWRMRLDQPDNPELILEGTDRLSSPAISHDGRRLAYALTRIHRVEIWKMPLDQAKAQAAPLISSTHSELNPNYSPDGRRIAFHSTRSGTSDIWIAYADGSSPWRLTYTNGPTTASPRWSPDGQQIAFESNRSGQFEIYRIASTGGTAKQLSSGGSMNALPSWSRDGKWIYFCSNRSGRYEVWKMPASGGNPVQVTKTGGWVAFESLDSRFLYYTQYRIGGPLWRIPLAGGPPEQVIPRVSGLFFAPAPGGVYFQSGGREISFWDENTRRVSPLVTAPNRMNIGLALSPDYRSLLFTQVVDEGSDIYMIDGLK